MRKRIIAVDFDGTVVEHEFPNIGMPQPGALQFISNCLTRGDYVIIWTCRTGRYLKAVKEYFAKNGFDHKRLKKNLLFNENAPLDFKPEPKVYYDVLIDDRNYGGLPMTSDGFVDWHKINQDINGNVV